MTTEPRQTVSAAVDALRPELTALSRHLYLHPELSLAEHASTALLQERLAKAGFLVTPGVAGLPTSFIASYRSALPGPRIAFLAEYDALPGIGHACGHNLIAAAGLGAGLGLAACLDRVGGEVLVIGTPAEETIGGKCVMVREGVFAGIDAALMVHPGSEWRAESDSLACASLEVLFTGREAHAVAWPERGINALDALIQLFVAVDMMKKRLGRDVRIPGVILEGGVRANIIPARAVGHFSLRAPSSERRDEIRSEFERLVEGIARGTGCGHVIRAVDEPYDDLLTNKTMADRFAAHLRDAGVTVVSGPRINKGSLDMGNVSRAVPSIHPFVAICDASVASHTRGFADASVSEAGERALMIAARALALTGLDLLTHPELLVEARNEFARSMGRPCA